MQIWSLTESDDPAGAIAARRAVESLYSHLEVDADAAVRFAADGSAWVAVWVFVPDEQIEDPR